MGCSLTAAIDSPAPTGQGEPARHNTTTTAQRRPYVVKARASSDPSSVGGAGSTFTLGGLPEHDAGGSGVDRLTSQPIGDSGQSPELSGDCVQVAHPEPSA